MLRPKSSSGGRSFLDELLGDDGFGDGDTLSGLVSGGDGGGGTSVSGPGGSARQRKSVRFFDSEKDLQTKLQTSTSRPHSSTLDSLLNSTGSKTDLTFGESITKPSQQNTGRASSADWLGLSAPTTSDSETEETRSKTNRIKSDFSGSLTNNSGQNIPNQQQQQQQRQTNSRPSTSITLSTSNSSTSSADWITSGLAARSPAAALPANAPPSQRSTNDPPLWQPKLLDTTTSRVDSVTPTTPTSGSKIASTPESRAITSQISESHVAESSRTNRKTEPVTDPTMTTTIDHERAVSIPEPEVQTLRIIATNTEDSVVHQTKVRMLDMEKQFLEQTIEQMKINHSQEIKSMIEIYDQQMRMTSEMYRRHELMIQEERDRRIEEMKRQVENGEAEFEHHRTAAEARFDIVEQQWRSDVEKIREQNRAAIERLQNEHSAELVRLRERLESSASNVANTSVESLSRQSESLTELLSKWEESAFKIEQLQRSVLAHQQTLGRPDVLEPLTAKFADIETAWKKFIDDYPGYVSQLDETLKTEREKLLQTAEHRTEAEIQKLQNEREELQKAKIAFSHEVEEWRRQEAMGANVHQSQREKLSADILIFEERRRALETLYEERKRNQEKEEKALEKQMEQFQTDRRKFDDERTMMTRERTELDNQRTKLEAFRLEFEAEKEQLSGIAQKLSTKAEDLEKLSQVALREKMDAMKAAEDAESAQREIHAGLEEIQRSTMRRLEDERRLAMERAQLTQQWALLREFAESAVCNLCGTSLNYLTNNNSGNFPTITRTTTAPTSHYPKGYSGAAPVFSGLLTNRQRRLGQSLLNIDEIEAFQQSNNEVGTFDGEKAMLQLKMDSQRDDALLAEETNFVRMLRARQKK